MKRKANISLIPLDKIRSNKNVRTGMESESLEDLKNSIRTQGLLQPVTLLNPLNEEEDYQILMGHRRVEAFRLLAASIPKIYDAIPAILVLSLDGDDIDEIQLVENLQREGLSARDIQNGLRVLRDKGLSHLAIAKRLGKSEGYVRNLFTAINTLDRNNDLQDLVDSYEQLTITDIQEVQGLDPWTQVALLKARASGTLASVKALREKVSEYRNVKKQVALKKSDTANFVAKDFIRARGKKISFKATTIQIATLKPEQKADLRTTLEEILKKLD